MMDAPGAPRILHVAETIRGGIATYLNELHPFQRATFGAGNVRHVVPEQHRGDLHAIEGDSVVGFDRAGRDLVSLWRMTATVCGLVHRWRPSIVHLHSSYAGLVLRPVLKVLFPRLLVVYCPHGWAFSRDTSRLSHLVARITERVLAPFCTRIVCISDHERLAGEAIGIAPAKLAVVRSGIGPHRPTVEAAAWDDPRLKVLFVGRLDRQKGYDLLLEAASQLRSAVAVRVVGSVVVGTQRAVEAPDNVALLGWQEREAIEAQLAAADVVVVPSRWEGFGLVVLEAMRARKPVVAFAVGALPEIIQDGRTGFLCTPASADALAEGLSRCLSAPMAEMGAAGARRFADHFLSEYMHERLRAVYESLPGSAGVSAPHPQEAS